MSGLCSWLASCLAWGVQHWSLLVIEWSCVLALRWRSLGELLLTHITWGQEVSGGPVSWTRLSHLSGSGLTPGWSTKTLSATWLRRKGRKEKRKKENWGWTLVHSNIRRLRGEKILALNTEMEQREVQGKEAWGLTIGFRISDIDNWGQRSGRKAELLEDQVQ